MADSDSNHHHHHDHEEEDEEGVQALRDALDAARGGLRSLVQRVIDTLDDGVLYVPLAEDIPDIPEDQEETFDELSFRPHMLLDNDENAYAVAFTEPALVENVQEALSWTTDDDELKFVRLPARSVFELALTELEDVNVGGIAIDPSTDRELVLSREEVQHILAGQAIPLVGYIEELPESDEDLPIVEGAEPPDPKLIAALDKAKSKIQDLVGYRVDTTFHPERDREPHLTITLYLARPDAPRGAIAEEVMGLVDPLLPPPGYADLVFKDAPN
jgi:hypothetical protein